MEAIARIAADDPGGLSIVVQGSLHRANHAAVAANLARWRAMYPQAQIVCAISSTDCFTHGAAPGPVDGLLPNDPADVAALASARSIATACNWITLAPPADVLPPIKTDSPGPNHLNLQIAAARAGLALATGRHVLRVRNDLLFGSRAILDRYAEAQGVQRGGRALFVERISVSQLFTLNPLTVQRMPFHVSDWFHLGLTSDVRKLWDAARPATAASAAWYCNHPHAAGSNAAERRFLTRLASEQRITFPIFAAAFPDLSLDHHNDTTCTTASLCVLADNFAIADMAKCTATLPKYQADIDRMSAFTQLECLSQDQLVRIAVQPGRSIHTLFQPELAAIAYHNGPLARLRRSARRWSRRIVRQLSAAVSVAAAPAPAFADPSSATRRS